MTGGKGLDLNLREVKGYRGLVSFLFLAGPQESRSRTHLIKRLTDGRIFGDLE